QQGTGEVFGVTDVAVGFALGMNLTDKFSIGFNPKFIHQKIWKMTATAGAIDIGVRYQTPFEGITLGMSVSNFGTKMQMQGNNALVVYDPDPEGSGNNGKIPANLATEEWELPLNFRVGLAYNVPMAGLGKLTLAVDAAHPSDNYESLNVGGEYVFNDLLYLRGGWRSLGIQDAEDGYTLGLGVKQYVLGNIQFSLDYAYQDYGRLTNIQKVTLGIGF
ncbi:MAG: PorV/PorQ family protein, partial [Bacteroidetes bacterium]|nr:PorV/PorQ family protein [Bacteroidota bacterium]